MFAHLTAAAVSRTSNLVRGVTHRVEVKYDARRGPNSWIDRCVAAAAAATASHRSVFFFEFGLPPSKK